MDQVLRRPRRFGVFLAVMLLGSLVFRERLASSVGSVGSAMVVAVMAVFWLLFGFRSLVPGPAAVIDGDEIRIGRFSTSPVPNLRLVTRRLSQSRFRVVRNGDVKEAMGQAVTRHLESFIDLDTLEISTPGEPTLRILVRSSDAASRFAASR